MHAKVLTLVTVVTAWKSIVAGERKAQRPNSWTARDAPRVCWRTLQSVTNPCLSRFVTPPKPTKALQTLRCHTCHGCHGVSGEWGRTYTLNVSKHSKPASNRHFKSSHFEG